MGKEIEIGTISNYYGGLIIKKEINKYYWAIENWDGTNFQEIPKYLYKVLIKYNKEYPGIDELLNDD